MIKANELRLGNYVEYHISDSMDERKQWWELDKIEGSDIQWLTENPDDQDYRPIPLTEEWLLKLGFEKTKENFCTYDLGKISIYMPSICYEEGRTYFNSWVIIEKSPKYVHQLQNLYFALTGEELELKLN